MRYLTFDSLALRGQPGDASEEMENICRQKHVSKKSEKIWVWRTEVEGGNSTVETTENFMKIMKIVDFVVVVRYVCNHIFVV